jgi:hypothetical protein
MSVGKRGVLIEKTCKFTNLFNIYRMEGIVQYVGTSSKPQKRLRAPGRLWQIVGWEDEK